MKNYINVTGVDLVKFAQKVYELSVPQGLGFLHFAPVPLSNEDATKLVENCKKDSLYALSMDYVHGRSCKMDVLRKDGELKISNIWYDHTNEQLKELLGCFGITITASPEHFGGCECIDCKHKRGDSSW